VPRPTDNVDLITALHMADRDEQNFKALFVEAEATGRDVPTDALLIGMINTTAWMQFLAVRDPDPVGRRRAAATAIECERMVNRTWLKLQAAAAKRQAQAKPYRAEDYFTRSEDLPWPESPSGDFMPDCRAF
jgi:hypothetical protein